ncbi:hypothetical protein ACTOB_004977 [Actinoplanes oblitus]|uniref:Uncharacterized protein n=1 Tax=Actinoplanes oblitus TaxID=3040509 RepID=A0ABY8W7M9_9ACTN|nr:hypothetical protein [Actinoplanes oblitus]WIM93012.1 hypothetical protein ACTOB_004977 [Actinoplanes oblitus]
MIPILEEVEKDGASWQEMCLRLGRILGLDSPVPGSVLRRARADDRFAAHLMICRGTPDLLKEALFDAGNRAFERPQDSAERSVTQLGRGLVSSLASWVADGARFAPKDLHEQRLSTCRSCPHLVDPPTKLVYRVALVGSSDQRVCHLCGCVATRKARVASEKCPAGYW